MDTVTSYFTFSPGAKARASEVNANFMNYRGTIVPIDPNTATATDGTYDMGTSEHRWRGIYGQHLDLEGSTSTTNLTVVPDTSYTAGAADLKIGSTSIMRMEKDHGVSFPLLGKAVSPASAGTIGDTTGFTTFLTLSLTTYSGNWVQGLLQAGPAAFPDDGNCYFTDGLGNVSGVDEIGAIQIARDGTVIFEQYFHHNAYTTGSYAAIVQVGDTANTNTSIPVPYGLRCDVPPIHFIDNSCSAGGHTYTFAVKMFTNHTGTASFIYDGLRAFLMETIYRS